MAKIALLIGTSEYLESDLKPLPSANRDVRAMQKVLQDSEIGGFDQVQLLENPELQEMEGAIESLFTNRQRDDLILLYFSGHAIKDENGKLYFATCKTRKSSQGEFAKSTALRVSSIHDFMNDSRSRRQVIILDCCFSGAFTKGMTSKDVGSLDIKDQLGGEGRAVLASSTSVQYSFEQSGEELSIYTRYLVEGLERGTADINRDGVILVGELHEYAKKRVQGDTSAMKPEIYPDKEGYTIQLAKSKSTNLIGTSTYKCFLIAPYGEKPLLMDIKRTEDFDLICDGIRSVVEQYEKTRTNVKIDLKDSRDFSGGVITKDFFRQLYSADLVVAEISAYSPNVFYELGVRMALRKSATILLALEGTDLPFDLKNVRVVFYQKGKLRDKREELHRLMDVRLNGEVDSPVYDALPDLEIRRSSEIDKLLEQIKELQEQLSIKRDEEKALSLLDQGLSFCDIPANRKDLEKIVQIYRQAYGLAANNFQVVFAYGKILHQVAQYDEAVQVLERAVQLNLQGSQPLSEPYRELGLAYRRRGTKQGNRDNRDCRKARECMIQATHLNHDDDDAWGILGGLHKRLDEIKEAIQCYRTGLEVNPNSTYCLVNELMLLILCLKNQASEDLINDRMRLQVLAKRAETILSKVKLDSQDYWRVVNRAEVSLLLENTEDALKFYSRAAEIADTPDKLKSALDNLTYIQDRISLPGTDEARDLLFRRREEIIPEGSSPSLSGRGDSFNV